MRKKCLILIMPNTVSRVTWIRPFNSTPSFHNITLLFSCQLLCKLQPDYFLSVKNVGLCLQCVLHPRRGSGSLQEVTAGQWDITCCCSTTDISKVSATTTTKHPDSVWYFCVWLVDINILEKSAASIFISNDPEVGSSVFFHICGTCLSECNIMSQKATVYIYTAMSTSDLIHLCPLYERYRVFLLSLCMVPFTWYASRCRLSVQ